MPARTTPPSCAAALGRDPFSSTGSGVRSVNLLISGMGSGGGGAGWLRQNFHHPHTPTRSTSTPPDTPPAVRLLSLRTCSV